MTKHPQLTLTFHIAPQLLSLLGWKWKGLLPEGCAVCQRKLKREYTAVAYFCFIHQRALKWQQILVVLLPLLPGNYAKLNIFEQKVFPVGSTFFPLHIC